MASIPQVVQELQAMDKPPPESSNIDQTVSNVPFFPRGFIEGMDAAQLAPVNKVILSMQANQPQPFTMMLPPTSKPVHPHRGAESAGSFQASRNWAPAPWEHSSPAYESSGWPVAQIPVNNVISGHAFAAPWISNRSYTLEPDDTQTIPAVVSVRSVFVPIPLEVYFQTYILWEQRSLPVSCRPMRHLPAISTIGRRPSSPGFAQSGEGLL